MANDLNTIARTEPPVPFDALLGANLDAMAAEKTRPVDATPTPWPTWNAKCRGAGGGKGIARGWHVVVGARSGNGKSILGACMAAEAVRHGERVAIISLEMAQIEMATRVLAIVSGEHIERLEHGPTFDRQSWDRARDTLNRCYREAGGVLYVNRKPIARLRDIADSILFLNREREVRYFVVDYMQLAAMVNGASELLDKVAEVSHVVRGLAKDLGVTTVGMSQLNRSTSAADETPRKEGLMGGSPLENDADQVLLLDHSRAVRDPVAGGVNSFAVLDKNRHGPGCEIPTYLSAKTLAMVERLPDEVP